MVAGPHLRLGAASATCPTRSARRARRCRRSSPDAGNPDVLVERLEPPVPARHDVARGAQDDRQRRQQDRRRRSAAAREDGAQPRCSSRSTIRCRNERPRASGLLALTSPQRRRLLKFAAATGLLAAVERNVALRAVGRRLQGAGLRLPAGRQRRREHADPLRHRRVPELRGDPARRRRASTSRRRSCCRSSRRAAARRTASIRRARRCRTLFNQKKLAVVANVGMLVQPSTKAGLETGGAPRPANLFSHSDQELALQSAVHTGFERVGWGGRIADRLDAANPGTLFPPLVSISGLRTFVIGRTSVPLTVPSEPVLHARRQRRRLLTSSTCCATRRCARCSRRAAATSTTSWRSSTPRKGSRRRRSCLADPAEHERRSWRRSSRASTPTSAAQLRTIAQLIEGRAQTQMRGRCSTSHQGGYDTHGSQAGIHAALLGDLVAGVEGVPGRDGRAGPRPTA